MRTAGRALRRPWRQWWPLIPLSPPDRRPVSCNSPTRRRPEVAPNGAATSQGCSPPPARDDRGHRQGPRPARLCSRPPPVSLKGTPVIPRRLPHLLPACQPFFPAARATPRPTRDRGLKGQPAAERLGLRHDLVPLAAQVVFCTIPRRHEQCHHPHDTKTNAHTSRPRANKDSQPATA